MAVRVSICVAVGMTVGMAVGMTVGMAIGMAIGVTVGVTVGVAVDVQPQAVGLPVRSPVRSHIAVGDVEVAVGALPGGAGSASRALGRDSNRRHGGGFATAKTRASCCCESREGASMLGRYMQRD